MNILFWNLKRRPILDLVAALAAEKEADLVVLAEAAEPPVSVTHALASAGPYTVPWPSPRTSQGSSSLQGGFESTSVAGRPFAELRHFVLQHAL